MNNKVYLLLITSIIFLLTFNNIKAQSNHPNLILFDEVNHQSTQTLTTNQQHSLNTTTQSQQQNVFYKNADTACWDEAAKYHGIDPWLLYAIAYVESSHNPRAISRPNRNGTYDIGLMQINSIHLPTLSRYGITKNTLMNACASTYVGAWILSEKINRYGWSWQAIAAYNVGSLNNPTRTRIGRSYANKVYEAYYKLTNRRI